MIGAPRLDATGEFLELFDRRAGAGHAYLERRVGRDDANDLLAEVWLRAVASRASYRGDWPDGRPWLYGVARNTVHAHWQQHSRERRRYETMVSDPWSDVDTRLDAEALGGALRHALLALS